jgi:endoglucanase
MAGEGKGEGLTRRQVLKGGAAALAIAALGAGCGRAGGARKETGMIVQTKLPRWRGFNIHNLFAVDHYSAYEESDFQWVADWGFDFVRLAVSHVWAMRGDDAYAPNEQGLAEIDRGIELARKYRLHANLDMHTAPGYAYHESQMRGARDLWKDEATQDGFAHLWRVFAERYRDIPSTELSFNILNEPAARIGRMSAEEHARVIGKAVRAIREVSPERLIIADGVEWASRPAFELVDLGVAQSYHFYAPHTLTHYRAEWAGPEAMRWPEPVWPGQRQGEETWDRSRLEREFAPWLELIERGVGVHAGEGGVYNKTPHAVALGWLRDTLEMLKGHNVGYALWNLRGPFGVLDSERADVDYEDFHGHKLDRKMLELLQSV